MCPAQPVTYVSGRSMFTNDDSVLYWGADGPTGYARLPGFVVSHEMPKKKPKSSEYTFIDGIEAALTRAKAAAGEKGVTVMGGTEIAQEDIHAG